MANINCFIHQYADVQTKDIGDQTKIWQYVVVLPNAKIGSNCNICSHCFIENHVIIGDDVTLKCGAQVYDGVTIENKVFIGPGVIFCNDRYPKSKNINFKMERTLVKTGASIGANSTILPGITIGRDSLIAAGSVVTRNVLDGEVYFNNYRIGRK